MTSPVRREGQSGSLKVIETRLIRNHLVPTTAFGAAAAAPKHFNVLSNTNQNLKI